MLLTFFYFLPHPFRHNQRFCAGEYLYFISSDSPAVVVLFFVLYCFISTPCIDLLPLNQIDKVLAKFKYSGIWKERNRLEIHFIEQ